jgi:H+/gluconate symporter-like permease
LAPSAELAGGTTPRQSTGAIRWALIAVLIIGAAGALGGTVLRSGRIPRWLIRGRSSAR